MRLDQNDLFRALSLLPVKVSVLDGDMNLLYSNSVEFVEDVEEESGKCHRIYHGVDEVCPGCLVTEELRSKEPLEAAVTTDEGRCLEVCVHPVLDDMCGVRIIVHSSRDITGLKASVQALEESGETYRMILEHTRDIIFALDSQGRYTYTSPAYKKIGGIDGDRGIGYPFDHNIHPLDRGRAKEALLRIGFEGEELADVEMRLRHHDGEWHWYAVSGTPLIDGEGGFAGIVGVARWVEDKKKAEEALRRANRQLSLLTGMTRHDVRNQLLALQGYLHLMLEEQEMRDDAMIARLTDIAELMSRQIEFTSVYQQIGSHEPQWQRLDGVLPMECDFAGVDFRNGAQGIEVYSDPLLSKVFFNLLHNSLEHGGGVETIMLGHHKRGGSLVIEWRDDGVGVPQENKDRIFDQGFGRNTGMGLFMSREILSITGIAIRETGTPGEGACFQMTVPRGHHRTERH